MIDFMRSISYFSLVNGGVHPYHGGVHYYHGGVQHQYFDLRRGTRRGTVYHGGVHFFHGGVHPYHGGVHPDHCFDIA